MIRNISDETNIKQDTHTALSHSDEFSGMASLVPLHHRKRGNYFLLLLKGKKTC